jgi:predicted GIY-YIG superfamily endonuclease
MLRDRLLARLAEMGDAPDHQQLAAEILGIKGAPPELAKRLVAQALVLEDRREVWRLTGERICRDAPPVPGVYVLKDAAGRALYVGKAVNLRRRLRSHFAERRWRAIKAEMSRVASAEWHEVGSEIEALLREASLIHDLHPPVNVQIAAPDPETREIPSALRRDVLVVQPSVEPDSVELIAAAADGRWLIQRTRRNGYDLAVHARRIMKFFAPSPRGPRTAHPRTPHRGDPSAHLAPLVFSWLAGRGVAATRLNPHDAVSAASLKTRLAALFADDRLFVERLDQR